MPISDFGYSMTAHFLTIPPLIKNNELWLGATCNSEDMVFSVPEGAEVSPKDREKAAKLGYVGNYTRLGNSNWFTNLEHGRRHQPIQLMSMADNLKFSKHKQVTEDGYLQYDNFDAIEVPYVDAIPNDYDGMMGVPITFLDKYCPEQFEIIDTTERWSSQRKKKYTVDEYKNANDLNATWVIKKNGEILKGYKRILIRKRVQE